MEVESTSFQCNNLTVSKTLVCQNLQIRYSKSKSQETLRLVHLLFIILKFKKIRYDKLPYSNEYD